MQCADFEVRLNEILDARKTPEQDAVLRAHTDRCASCRHDLRISTEMLLGLELTPPFSPDDDFAAKVVAQFLSQPAASKEQASSSKQVLYRAAAAVLAASLMCVLAVIAPKFAGQTPLAGDNAVVVAQPGDTNPLAAPGDFAGPVQSPSTHYSEILELVATRLPPVEALSPSDELAGSLRPFSVAIEALRKAIPSTPRGNPPTEEKPQALRTVPHWVIG